MKFGPFGEKLELTHRCIQFSLSSTITVFHQLFAFFDTEKVVIEANEHGSYTYICLSSMCIHIYMHFDTHSDES